MKVQASTPIAAANTASVRPIVATEGELGERSKQLLTQIASYALLQAGWNGFAAPAPSALALKNAQALVLDAAARSVAVERVEPSAMGGAGVTFAADPREVVVEFYNDGTAHALLTDDATGDIATQSVRPGPDGHQELINNIHKYLHGE